MTQSDTLASSAIAALNRGDLAAAERFAHEALRLAPHSVSALVAHGAAMNARGIYGPAIKSFRRLTQIEPKQFAHWMNLASAQRAAGDLRAAELSYAASARLNPTSPELLYNSALLDLELGHYEQSRRKLKDAAIAAPLNAEIGYQYAHICVACADTEAAIAAVDRWERWRNWTPELLGAFGSLLLTLGQQDSVSKILSQLRSFPTRSAEVELSLISILERTNALEEATAALQRLERSGIEISKELSQRWLAVRAHLAARNGRHDEAIALYEEILVKVPALPERQDFLFPMAKTLDAKGDYLGAYDAASRAHAAQMAFVDLSSPLPEGASTEVLNIASFGCDARDVEAWQESAPPLECDSPVFIVAFPRSGTTLLEQMLDAHPDLRTMDEQPFLQHALASLQQQGAVYPDALAQLEVHQLSEARRVYWQGVHGKLRLKPGQRLLDKNPLNMLRLPAIRRLFPKSPILLAIRHPFDVIISNYFQHYRAPEFARLCRDLPTLALGYRRAFDFWYQQEQLLRPKVLEIFYERFVGDFESSARRICDFLSLEWHEDMLQPWVHARSKGYISTPSYSQVVQPVNNKAVGRWRRYEQVLLPLQGELIHLMRRWGYELN